MILKALAFRSRGESKDAYDLYYTVRNFNGGIEDIARRINTMASHPETAIALAVLRENFTEPDHPGPFRAAKFSGEESVDVMRQDVVGFVRELLAFVDRLAGQG